MINGDSTISRKYLETAKKLAHVLHTELQVDQDIALHQGFETIKNFANVLSVPWETWKTYINGLYKAAADELEACKGYYFQPYPEKKGG